jgi:hypothetical protein
MKRAFLTMAASMIAHVVFWAIALVTASAAHAEFLARGIDHLDAERLLELAVRDGLWSGATSVLVAGMIAALCISPFLEMALAGTAAGSGLRAAFREAARLTPASAVLTLTAAFVTVAVLGFAAILPWGIDLLLADHFDDRAHAFAVAIASTPALVALLPFGLAVDVGRLRLARGGALLESVACGFRATRSRLFALYVMTLAAGLAASVAHAWLGRNDDAPSLIAGGVVLLVRPVTRAAFMLVAARHELTR